MRAVLLRVLAPLLVIALTAVTVAACASPMRPAPPASSPDTPPYRWSRPGTPAGRLIGSPRPLIMHNPGPVKTAALAVTDMRAAWFGTWCLHRNPIAVAVNARDPGVMARGTVKFFKADKGYGAIASPDLPDGLDAWVHFSAIEMDGYRFLEAGDQVEFGYEAAQQDSFRFVATWVRRL